MPTTFLGALSPPAYSLFNMRHAILGVKCSCICRFLRAKLRRAAAAATSSALIHVVCSAHIYTHTHTRSQCTKIGRNQATNILLFMYLCSCPFARVCVCMFRYLRACVYFMLSLPLLLLLLPRRFVSFARVLVMRMGVCVCVGVSVQII